MVVAPSPHALRLHGERVGVRGDNWHNLQSVLFGPTPGLEPGQCRPNTKPLVRRLFQSDVPHIMNLTPVAIAGSLSVRLV